ncbi:hypothetical protein Dsin_014576 [Dipteronia sinensis]|uniref:Uncharacterized protein n=1 Tax=Dipteronia sinensis TaxID=43782 RepID=A0AAE0AM84_9ROSI|nr:hypothetical protein Dsin_014576 [Dipteronia sinensis]
MILRLQAAAVKSPEVTHCPFHLAGTGPRLRSLKLSLSGQIPVSMTPMTRSDPKSDSLRRVPALSVVFKPRNCGERVVCRWRTCSGMTARMWGRVLRCLS